MLRDDIIRPQHMLDAAREALGFARGRVRADSDVHVLVLPDTGHSLFNLVRMDRESEDIQGRVVDAKVRLEHALEPGIARLR